MLGFLYYQGSISKPFHGKPISKDLKKAFHWYKKSAEQGSPEAQYYLAELYINGEGVPVNIPEAIRLLKLAVANGGNEANRLLGSLYFLGRGVKKDHQKAMSYFSKVKSKKTKNGNYSGLFLEAEKGDPKALYKLGHDFKFGSNVIQDTRTSIKYLVASSRKGNSSAAQSLAKSYMEGFNVPKDYVLAYMWFNLCAADRNAYSIRASRQRLFI